MTLYVDFEKDSFALQEIKDCPASLEVERGRKLLRISFSPKRTACKLELRTGVTDYTFIRTDEDGGRSDTALKMLPSKEVSLACGHNYIFQMQKKGFRAATFSFKTDRDTVLTYKDFRQKSRFAQAGLSLLFPGTGQYYGDRRTAGGWYRGLAITLIAVTAVDAAVLGISKGLYDDANRRYQTEADQAKRHDLDVSRSNAMSTFHIASGVFTGSSIALGFVWTINIVDPLIFSIGRNTRL